MKKYRHIVLLITYSVVLLHSAIPHCHGKCEDERNDNCEMVLVQDHHGLIEVLSHFFSNAKHTDSDEQINCHVGSYLYKVESTTVQNAPLQMTHSRLGALCSSFIDLRQINPENEQVPDKAFLKKETRRGPPQFV